MRIICIGYKGEIGRAISNIFNINLGIDKEGTLDYIDGHLSMYKYVEEGCIGNCILHVCIPYSETFDGIVEDYIDKYKPMLTIIHSTVPWWFFVGVDTIVHCPVNGKHPNMESDIRKYTMFVGCKNEKIGQMACEYLEYHGLNTYLSKSPQTIAFAKLCSTEFLKVQIEFFQKIKSFAVDHEFEWAEVIEFFKAINYKTFQRAGEIDSEFSRKHCIMNNHKLFEKL